MLYLKHKMELISKKMLVYLKNKRSAFTLAEVLITLMIIGIIAMITVPGLYLKFSKQIWAIQAKKAYSLLAVATAVVSRDFDNLTQFIPDSLSNQHNDEVAQAYAEALNARLCGATITSVSMNRCTGKYDYYPKTLDGSVTNANTAAGRLFGTGYHFLFKNNMMMAIHPLAFGGTRNWPLQLDDNKRAKYLFTIDVNGLTGPNIYGRDIFSFVLMEGGKPVIKPFYYSKKNDCNTATGTGYDCANYLLQNNWKMDY